MTWPMPIREHKRLPAIDRTIKLLAIGEPARIVDSDLLAFLGAVARTDDGIDVLQTGICFHEVLLEGIGARQYNQPRFHGAIVT